MFYVHLCTVRKSKADSGHRVCGFDKTIRTVCRYRQEHRTGGVGRWKQPFIFRPVLRLTYQPLRFHHAKPFGIHPSFHASLVDMNFSQKGVRRIFEFSLSRTRYRFHANSYRSSAVILLKILIWQQRYNDERTCTRLHRGYAYCKSKDLQDFFIIILPCPSKITFTTNSVVLYIFYIISYKPSATICLWHIHSLILYKKAMKKVLVVIGVLVLAGMME